MKTNNRTQRDSFFDSLYRLACEDPSLVVVTADAGAPSLDRFRESLPRQFINVGIAEQNAVDVGAGLAMAGRKAVIYAMAPFITLRCLEQIKIAVGIVNLPLTIAGVGAGFGYEESGPTHHLCEDLAAMRAIPNLTILSISDGGMAADAALRCHGDPRPRYVRLDRRPLPDIYPPGADFSAGFARLREGDRLCLIGTGAMVHAALDVAGRLAARGISASVLDARVFPLDGPLLAELTEGVPLLVTLEEHFLPGGLGSAVAEVMADLGLGQRLVRLGLEHRYLYVYGGRESIRKAHGLDLKAIESRILALLDQG